MSVPNRNTSTLHSVKELHLNSIITYTYNDLIIEKKNWYCILFIIKMQIFCRYMGVYMNWSMCDTTDTRTVRFNQLFSGFKYNPIIWNLLKWNIEILITLIISKYCIGNLELLNNWYEILLLVIGTYAQYNITLSLSHRYKVYNLLYLFVYKIIQTTKCVQCTQ